MTHHIDILSAQKCRCLSRCVSSHCRGEEGSVFGGLFCLEDNSLSHLLFCVVLVVRFPKNQAVICLQVFYARVSFVGFGSSWYTDHHSRMLFTFGLICVNQWFITCHDVRDVFGSTVIVFLEHIFWLIDTRLLSDWQIV